jgi:hypothetical protein
VICTQTLALYRTILIAYAGTGLIASVFMFLAFRKAVFDNAVMAPLLKAHTEMRPMVLGFSIAFAAVLATSWPMCIVCWAILRAAVLLTLGATHQKHVEDQVVPMGVLDKALMDGQVSDLRVALLAHGYEQEEVDGREAWFSPPDVPVTSAFYFSKRKGPLWLITYSCMDRVEIVGHEEAVALATGPSTAPNPPA